MQGKSGQVVEQGGARCEAAGMGAISHGLQEFRLLLNPSRISPNPAPAVGTSSRAQEAGKMLGAVNNRYPDSLQGRRQGCILNPRGVTAWHCPVTEVSLRCENTPVEA